MTTRRQFVLGAVATAVSAAIPSAKSKNIHERCNFCGGWDGVHFTWCNDVNPFAHSFSLESDMCLRCRMTRLMIEETGMRRCPGTALYDHETYGVSYATKLMPVQAEMSRRYAQMLARTMMQTREIAAANVFNRGF